MKKTHKNIVGKYVTTFLTHYLAGQKNVSHNTISSYAATLYLFFQYCRDVKKIPAENMVVEKISKQLIIDFLLWLEQERGSSISTRNQRLAAIRSFFKFLQYENPQFMGICQDILNIPVKKTVKPMVTHLSHDELKLILNQPDIATAKGKRVIALLAILYDTGARVSEIINLKVCDIRFDFPPMVTLTGKGRKIRYVPIMQETFSVLQNYMLAYKIDKNAKPTAPLFFNSRGEKLTRAGVSNIISRCVNSAKKENPALPEKITPHVFRHSKAVHLTEIDTPLNYIRDILGHSSVLTTEIYIRINPELRKKYMEAAHIEYIPNANETKWEKNDELVEWLKKMCK
ncbi:MAG: integrase [Lentisphaerae bacterium]|nr:integrase [Lentisphaerota bacterium]